MTTPGSLDHGSVMRTISFDGTHYGLEVYPRLVHAIKAFRSRLQGDIPKTLRGVQVKTRAGLEAIQFLPKVDPGEMGGFRIELTIGASSLAEARAKVQAVPMLEPNFSPHPPDPYMSYKLKANTVTKDGLLANAGWVYHQHTLANQFEGTDASRPKTVQVEIMTDVLTALGGMGAGADLPSPSPPLHGG